MTYTQMHDLLDVLLDKSDQPWFNTSEKDQFLNLAYMEFIMQTHKSFETNEKKRQDIAPLVRRIKVETNSIARTIMLSTFEDFLFLLSMSGVFVDTCGGETVVVNQAYHNDTGSGTPPGDGGSNHYLYETAQYTNTQTTGADNYTNAQHVNIRPVQIDDFNATKDDPFNKPTDSNPLYVVRGDVLSHGYVEIYSDTAPKAVYIDYMKKPQDIDTTNSPAGSIVLPEYTHEEIVNIAVRKMLENIESPQRYQTQRVEIAERTD